MAKPDTRKLKNDAQQAQEKGKFQKAVEYYQELESLEPKDAEWARRAADCHRRLGNHALEIAALARAAERYSASGFLVKAIAMCKMILAKEPGHTETQERLAALYRDRELPAAALSVSGKTPARPTPVTPMEVARPTAEPVVKSRRRTLPPNTPLDAVQLSAVVPGAKPAAGAQVGVFEIPLDEEEIQLDEPPPLETSIETLGRAAHAQTRTAPPAPAPVDRERESARDAAIDVFPRTPLFSDLTRQSFFSLIEKVLLIELDRGEPLFRQGDPADSLYVVAEGEIAVIDEGPPRVQLGRLAEGEFFGEIGLMTDQPRYATAEAIAPTHLLKIDRNVIGDLIEIEPSVLKVLLRFLRDRLIDNLVRTSPLFQPFGGGERFALAGRFLFLEVERESVLIRQGQMADGLFILLTGRAEVIRDQDGEPRRLATLNPGDLCGEMSLLTHEPAIATVRAATKCFALELVAKDFRELIMTHPQVLVFVGDLAEQRRRENEAIVGGAADYAEGHLDLV
jgi:CRP-like cAMP-binding protein